jgi:sugar-specific transcriptional regulator TrmB
VGIATLFIIFIYLLGILIFMEKEYALQKLGLSETESKIYLTLLKIGESTAVQIAKKTTIHRRTIYDNLNLLIKKGLVNYIEKNKIKYYNASNPKAFDFILEEKQDILSKIMPSLVSSYEETKKALEISVYEDVSGMKSLIEEINESKSEICWIGAGGFIFDLFGYSKNLLMKKLQSLKIRMIHPDNKKFRNWKKELKNASIRTLSKNSITSTLAFGVIEDKVIFGTIEDKNCTIIRIKSKEFAKGFKNYFEIMWMVAKPMN